MWYLLQTGARSAAENMAWDEVLLGAAPELGQPLLRFYSWSEPAASFGYFQKISEVSQLTSLRPLIRRPTGGGLVPHEADWTYSLVFPPTHRWYQLKAVDSYERIHAWIQAAFARDGITTELALSTRKELPGLCFIGAEQHDLLWHNRKIAGAAQRRSRTGLLIQGSIQSPPPALAKADWQKAFCDVAHHHWGVEWIPFLPEPKWETRVKRLVEEKYASARYNEAR